MVASDRDGASAQLKTSRLVRLHRAVKHRLDIIGRERLGKPVVCMFRQKYVAPGHQILEPCEHLLLLFRTEHEIAHRLAIDFNKPRLGQDLRRLDIERTPLVGDLREIPPSHLLGSSAYGYLIERKIFRGTMDNSRSFTHYTCGRKIFGETHAVFF